MTEEQKAAYVISQSVCAMIEALGMVAENSARERRGESLAYPEKAFQDLIVREGIYHNAVLSMFHNIT